MILLFLYGLSLASTTSLLGSSAFGELAGCWLGRWGQLGHMSSITQQDNLDLFTRRLNGVPREGNFLSSLESQKFHKITSAVFYILKQVTRSKIQGAAKQIPPFCEICSKVTLQRSIRIGKKTTVSVVVNGLPQPFLNWHCEAE